MQSDQAIASALRRSARDPESYSSFYRANAKPILAFLTRRVLDPETGLELTAETFAEAYMARASFRGRTDAEAQAWLYTIARRQLSAYFRQAAVEKRARRRLGMQSPTLTEEDHARVLELADLGTLRGVLRDELARLSTPQQEALRLRVLEELPYAEVASRLKISEEAARARVARALSALAAALDQTDFALEA